MAPGPEPTRGVYGISVAADMVGIGVQSLRAYEKRGLLERSVNGEDRRARLVRLTTRGEKLHARLYPKAFEGQNRILEVLEPAERQVLLDLLVRVIEGNLHLARPGTGRRKRVARQ